MIKTATSTLSGESVIPELTKEQELNPDDFEILDQPNNLVGCCLRFKDSKIVYSYYPDGHKLVVGFTKNDISETESIIRGFSRIMGYLPFAKGFLSKYNALHYFWLSFPKINYGLFRPGVTSIYDADWSNLPQLFPNMETALSFLQSDGYSDLEILVKQDS